jgi:hypothetical protein
MLHTAGAGAGAGAAPPALAPHPIARPALFVHFTEPTSGPAQFAFGGFGVIGGGIGGAIVVDKAQESEAANKGALGPPPPPPSPPRSHDLWAACREVPLHTSSGTLPLGEALSSTGFYSLSPAAKGSRLGHALAAICGGPYFTRYKWMPQTVVIMCTAAPDEALRAACKASFERDFADPDSAYVPTDLAATRPGVPNPPSVAFLVDGGFRLWEALCVLAGGFQGAYSGGCSYCGVEMDKDGNCIFCFPQAQSELIKRTMETLGDLGVP